MKIIIIGSGLGGLAAAYIFSKDNHDVEVLEQHDNLSKKGSGLMVRPGASRILKSWGLEDEFEQLSDTSTSTFLRSLETGEVNMRSVAVDISDQPDWGIERPVLQDVLYRNAVKAGARIRFGCAVDDVRDDERHAWVRMKDGSERKADLVFAADGVRSKLRAKILADLNCPVDPIVSNVTLSGVSIATSTIAETSEMASLSADTNLNVWSASNGFVVGRLHLKSGHWGGTYGMKQPKELKSKRLWDEEGDIEQVRSHFANACPALKTALELAKTCDRWVLCELPPLPRWSSQSGRILLLGDSAHAMHPNAAQGFSQIVEDIGALRYLLQRRHGRPMHELVTIWEKVRIPRVERIKAYARWNTAMFTGESVAPTKDNGRNIVKSLKNVKPNMHAGFHSSPFLKWALDYDAIGEVKRYIEGSTASAARL